MKILAKVWQRSGLSVFCKWRTQRLQYCSSVQEEFVCCMHVDQSCSLSFFFIVMEEQRKTENQDAIRMRRWNLEVFPYVFRNKEYCERSPPVHAVCRIRRKELLPCPYRRHLASNVPYGFRSIISCSVFCQTSTLPGICSPSCELPLQVVFLYVLPVWLPIHCFRKGSYFVKPQLPQFLTDKNRAVSKMCS